MNKFRLKKVTSALIAAGLVVPAGYALGQTQNNPTITTRAPIKSNVMFIGAADGVTKARVTSTTTSAEAAGGYNLQVHFFSGPAAAGCAAIVAPDLDGGGTSATFGGPLSCTSSFNNVVLVYDTSATGTDGDFINGTVSQFAVINSAGAIAADGSVSAAALALASAGGANSLNANANYTGPIISSAVQSAPNGAVTLTFNANVAGDATGTTGVSAAANANVLAKKVVDGTNVGTATFLVTSTSALDAITVGSDTAASAFASAANKVAVAAGGSSLIFDTAGNPTSGQTVYSSFSGTSGVALASGTAKAVAGNFSAALASQTNRVDFWNPTLSTNGASAGTFDVTLRTNETLTGTFNTTTISVTPTIGGGSGVASGTDLIVTINMATAPANTEIGVNASGQLIATTDNFATSTPVTIGLNSTTVGTLMVQASGTAISTSGVAAVNVVAGAGTLPARGDLTLDSDINGFLDGATVRTNNVFGLAYTATEPSFGTASVAGLSFINDASTNTFASTSTLNVTSAINVVLTDQQNNDWNNSGSVTTADTGSTNYNLTNFGTGVTNPQWRLNTDAVTATTGTSSLNYANAFRATDGDVLPFNNSEAAVVQTTFVDNANPVVTGVEYTEVVAQGDVGSFGSTPRDAYGNARISLSEPVEGGSTGEILFNGQPVSLKNLDKNIDEKAQIDGGDRDGRDPKSGLLLPNHGLFLHFVPDPVGNVVTFSGATPNSLDVTETGLASSTDPDLLALSNATASANTVTLVTPTNLQITGAKIASVFTQANEKNAIIVDYNLPVAAPTGQTATDLDGIFVVRARIGSTRGTAFQDRDPGNPNPPGTPFGSVDQFYDFFIRGADVKIGTAAGGLGGANSVTLYITETSTTAGLPVDTKQIWVDYEGLGSATSKRSIRLATDSTKFAPDGTVNRFDGVLVSDAPATDTATPTTSISQLDADTVEVTFDALKLASNAQRRATRNLLTQSILGTATSDGTIDLADNTAIRADLIVFEDGIGLAGTAGRDPVVSEGGRIDIDRGPNSASGDPQTVAIRNTAVPAATFLAFNKAVRNLLTAIKTKVTTPGITNASKAAELINPERDILIKQFLVDPTSDMLTATSAFTGGDLDNSPGKVFAFVEVTTGAGALAAQGDNGANTTNVEGNSQNANAEFGRTANLLRNLPNIQKNGTTYYPVEVNLVDGSINSIGNNNPVGGGQLNGTFFSGTDIIGTTSSTRPRGLRVRDTAFALVKDGVYNVIVGAPEADFPPTVLVPHSSISAPAASAFVLVSVFDPASGEYKAATSADASFAVTSSGGGIGHVRFQHDLSKATNIPTRVNVNLAAIGEARIGNGAGWQLVGLRGEMNRNAALPLSGRFFITVDPVTGKPISNFDLDNKTKDEAFTLGLGVLAPNELKVAFDSSSGVSVINLNPRPGAGLAFNYNVTFSGNTVDGGTGPSTMAAGTEVYAATSDGRLNDVDASVFANGMKIFYPIKPTFPTNIRLLPNSWHLVTIQNDRTAGLNDSASLPSGIDAVIIVDGVSGARVWFRNEPATTDAGDAIVLKEGDAIFVHTIGSGVSNFTF